MDKFFNVIEYFCITITAIGFIIMGIKYIIEKDLIINFFKKINKTIPKWVKSQIVNYKFNKYKGLDIIRCNKFYNASDECNCEIEFLFITNEIYCFRCKSEGCRKPQHYTEKEIKEIYYKKLF